MTTINVPRELLERAESSIEARMCVQCEGVPCCMPETLGVLSEIRALLAEQPQAGAGQDKWADYKWKHCGCKDASRLNSCRGLANCELPANHPERKQPPAQHNQGEVRRLRETLEHARYAVERGEYATGCCCCGSSVAAHGLGDGHSPVDEGDYFKLNVLKDIDAALTPSPKGEEE